MKNRFFLCVFLIMIIFICFVLIRESSEKHNSLERIYEESKTITLLNNN